MMRINSVQNYIHRQLNWIPGMPAPKSPEVIIIGNQKSGTTAIAALLAKYVDRSITLDIASLWGESEHQIYSGQRSLDDFVLANRYDFAQPMVKEPCLTFLLPQVRMTFPEAKLLFIVRDPRDNIRSILNLLGLPGHLEQLTAESYSAMPIAWKYVLDGSWMGLQGESYIAMLAARWNHAVELYIEHQAHIILIRYEDFVTDKSSTIETLATKLGFSQQRDITKFLHVQFQPKGSSLAPWQDFFGTKNLEAIEQYCAINMARLGYQQ